MSEVNANTRATKKQQAAAERPSAHTPGPWEVNGASQIVKFGEDWACIAEVNNPRPLKSNLPMAKSEPLEIGHPRFHEACANARLISVAPELLEACKEMTQLLSICIEEIESVGDSQPAARSTLKRALAAIAKAEGK